MIASLNRISFTAAVALCVSACAPSGVDGETRDVAKPRIVSLNPCIDAILVEIAEPAQILALSHYSYDPAVSSISQEVAQHYAATGGTVEEIIALQPDMVLASSFMPSATRSTLDQLGVRVHGFSSPNSVSESLTQIADLANLIGRSANGEALAEEIEDAVNEAQYDGVVSAALWQSGGIVPGEEQLVSELLRLTGFSSHSATLGLQQADYLSLEQVLASPPDVLLIAGQSRAQQHPALAKTDMQIAEFDPSLFYCGGPSIPRAIERLREIRRRS